MTTALFPDLIVNGETIPQAVVAAETQNHDAPAGKPGIAWRKAANAVALRTLLLQEARQLGIPAEPLEVGPGRFETEEEALIRGLLDTTLDIEQPTDDEVRAEWLRDPSRFKTPPLWEVSHILLACDPTDDAQRTAAVARAAEVIEKATANPKAFAKLAAETSDCGSRSAGGVLGQLTPGDTVPEFEAALHDLSDGQITPTPVVTRHGVHIIRMDAAAPRQQLPFDAVAPRLRLAMEKARWAAASRNFVNDLVARADVQGADFAPL